MQVDSQNSARIASPPFLSPRSGRSILKTEKAAADHAVSLRAAMPAARRSSFQQRSAGCCEHSVATRSADGHRELHNTHRPASRVWACNTTVLNFENGLNADLGP